MKTKLSTAANFPFMSVFGNSDEMLESRINELWELVTADKERIDAIKSLLCEWDTTYFNNLEHSLVLEYAKVVGLEVYAEDGVFKYYLPYQM